MKCAESRRNFGFVSRSLPLGSTAARRGYTGHVATSDCSIANSVERSKTKFNEGDSSA
jgi:hypothetical protein